MSDTNTPAPADQTIHVDPSASPAPAPAAAPDPAAKMIGTLAAERMASLTEPQRAAVRAVAGDDPVRQLETVRALAPTWTVQPRDTALAPSAPREGRAVTEADPRATYESLIQTNPVLAARYALANGVFQK